MNLINTRLINFQEMRPIFPTLTAYISPHKVKWALIHPPLDAQWTSPQTTRVSLKTNGLYKRYSKKTDFSELQYRFRIWYSLISNSYNSRTGPLPRREKFYRPRTNSPRGQWRAAEGNVSWQRPTLIDLLGWCATTRVCTYLQVYVSSKIQ